MRQRGFVLLPLIIIITLIGALGYFGYQNIQLRKIILISTPSPTPKETPNQDISLQTISPTPTPYQELTPKPLSAPTPEPTPEIDEAALIRHVLAEFEKYIGVSNTAGALQYFTPPVSDKAKAKLESIRTVNLPFRLTFWGFYINDDNYLLSDKIPNGYKMMMIEGRAGTTTYLTFELVRVGNNFLVDRYYHVGAIEGSNGEDLKYEGFGL